MMQHTTLADLPYMKSIPIGLAAAAIAAMLALFAFVPNAHAVTAAEKQAEAEAALANLSAMQETLDRLSAEYGEACMAQEKAEKKHDAAEKRIGEINEELTELQGQLGERARDMYRAGDVPFLDMVLGASTFEEFATSFDLALKVTQSNAEMIDRERELKKEAETQESVLEEQASVAAEKAAEAESAAQQAQATVAEMQATYDNLSAEAAQLLEEERKAREAEEAARAAAVMAAAQAAAEEEERARAAEAEKEKANEQTDEDGKDSESLDLVAQGTDEEAEDEEGEDAEEDEDADAEDEENADEEDEEGDEDEEDADENKDESEEGESEEPKEEDQPASEEPAYTGGSSVVERAQMCLGAPYVWGGVGPDGYDCSGLVSYCLTGSHSRLGTTYTFMEWPTVSDPQPGDIAVNWGHTGIYIGDGQMIHASTYGVGVITGPVQSGMKIVRYPG